MDTPIILKLRSLRERWIAYGEGSQSECFVEEEAKVGPFPQEYFPLIIIKDIQKDKIIISEGSDGEEKVLTPNGKVCFSYEIEGRECSDGCVCDGTEYYLQIIWEKKD